MADPVRFYFDQHVWLSAARGLQQRGVDVLTAQAAGRCGFADADQLAFAAAEERVMMTFDPDYLVLHRSANSTAALHGARYGNIALANWFRHCSYCTGSWSATR